jgi:hypothetical protein
MSTDASVYQRAMGTAFAQLHPALRRFHGLQGRYSLQGQVQCMAPSSWGARCLARMLGMPTAAQQGTLRFALNAQPGAETWTRHFPHHSLSSRLGLQGGLLAERLGLAGLRFGLQADGDRLVMQLHSLRFAGVPCPR